MILYTNGCSFTYGYELHDPTKSCWPKLLSEKLNVNPVNSSMTGKSNTWIFRQTLNYIFDNLNNLDSLFIIIGWTCMARIEYYNNDIRTIVIHEKLDTSFYDHDILKNSYESFFQDDLTIQKFYVIAMRDILNHYKIPYIFFNIRYDEMPINESCITTNERNILFDKKHYIDISMYDHCIKNGYKIGSEGHPLEDGHSSWANYLYDHIERNFHEEFIRMS